MASSYRRRGGHDRKDGRLIRSISSFGALLPHLVRTRSESANVYDDSFDVSKADRWLRAQDPHEFRGIGLLHLFIAAYVRTAAAQPEINRFAVGRRVYAHSDVEVVIPVKRSYESYDSDTVIKVSFESTDTVYDVYRKINEVIEEEEKSPEGNATGKMAGIVAKTFRFFRGICMFLAKVLDYFGLLPRKIISASPFHGSVMVNDLSSMGIGPVAHHLFNFGTLPVIMSLGSRRTAYEFDGKDSVVLRRYVDAKFTVDSRITDAQGFVSAFKVFKKHIEDPELLELPPQKIIDDIR